MQKLFGEWGFGSPTGVDLPLEGAGFMADADWAEHEGKALMPDGWHPRGQHPVDDRFGLPASDAAAGRARVHGDREPWSHVPSAHRRGDPGAKWQGRAQDLDPLRSPPARVHGVATADRARGVARRHDERHRRLRLQRIPLSARSPSRARRGRPKTGAARTPPGSLRSWDRSTIPTTCRRDGRAGWVRVADGGTRSCDGSSSGSTGSSPAWSRCEAERED